MTFARPDLTTLINRAEADIESRLPGADARLRRSNLNVLARVHAGATHGLYGFLDWIALQILPDTADADILERHANIWLPSGRVPAAYAVGQLTATGTNGVAIPAGTVFKRADGATYSSEAEAVIVAGQALVTIVADEAGQTGNAAAGVTLNLDSPIAGINAATVVTAGALTGGADIEDDDSLRARLLERIQQPPQGGSRSDYVGWAKEVPGVTRAWCYPEEMGDGTVTVRFVRDDDASLIPDVNEVAAVQAYIDDLRPVCAELFVVAPIPDPIAFQVQLVPATVATKAAVEASLRDLLLREAVPEGGLSEGKILVSHIREAISLAAGESDHVLVAPAADVAPATGHMATFGSIAWL
jgi:uncharacterized phage protein gp47/JayE